MVVILSSFIMYDWTKEGKYRYDLVGMYIYILTIFEKLIILYFIIYFITVLVLMKGSSLVPV